MASPPFPHCVPTQLSEEGGRDWSRAYSFCDGRLGSSDPDALCEQLAVVRGVAEEDLRALRALEVEVRVVLPGEADAAVDLDVLGRTVEVRVGDVRLGQRRDHGELLVVLGRGPRRVIRR